MTKVSERRLTAWKIVSLVALGVALFVALSVALPSVDARADDWPQWRGPARNGISRETDWLNGWPENGSPKVAWRAAVGKGHSTVAVAGGRAYTMGWDGSQDTVFCFDAAQGKLVWKQSYPCQTAVDSERGQAAAWRFARSMARLPGGTTARKVRASRPCRSLIKVSAEC